MWASPDGFAQTDRTWPADLGSPGERLRFGQSRRRRGRVLVRIWARNSRCKVGGSIGIRASLSSGGLVVDGAGALGGGLRGGGCGVRCGLEGGPSVSAEVQCLRCSRARRAKRWCGPMCDRAGNGAVQSIPCTFIGGHGTAVESRRGVERMRWRVPCALRPVPRTGLDAVRMLRERRAPRCTAGRDVRGGASLTRSASFMVLAPLRRVLCSSAFLFPLRSTWKASTAGSALPCASQAGGRRAPRILARGVLRS